MELQIDMSKSISDELQRIDAMARNDEYEAALQCVDALARSHPGEAALWRTRAYVNSRSGNRRAAIVDMDRAIQICNLEPDYFFTRGILLFKTENYQQAVVDFTKVIELCDYHGSEYYREGAYFLRADAYVRLRQFSEALQDCAHVRDGMRAWTDRLRSKEEIVAECR